MGQIYRVEDLVDVFDQHYKKYIADAQERKIKYPESSEKFQKEDIFCIALALRDMCEEIRLLKVRVFELEKAGS